MLAVPADRDTNEAVADGHPVGLSGMARPRGWERCREQIDGGAIGEVLVAK